MSNEKSFTINVVGTSGEKHVGNFKVKTKLSHRDSLRKDSFRRELLGNGAGQASQEAAAMAELFSTIWVHLLEAPPWWTNQANGLDLSDEEPVVAVFEQIVAARKEASDEMAKKAEEAKKTLAL